MTAAGPPEALRTHAADGVLLLTLNRPDARNALSPALIEDLHHALDRFTDDDALGAAVITGAGSAFCAGIDLDFFARADADRSRAKSLLRRFGDLPKPVVGAINGPAVAGGLEIVLGCDFLIGSPTAMFADSHVKIGAFPGGGMTARLPRAVGLRTAKAMSLAGLRLDAEAALGCGLIVELVERDRLVDAALEHAKALASRDAALLSQVRELMDRSLEHHLHEALAAEDDRLDSWRATGKTGWKV